MPSHPASSRLSHLGVLTLLAHHHRRAQRLSSVALSASPIPELPEWELAGEQGGLDGVVVHCSVPVDT